MVIAQRQLTDFEEALVALDCALTGVDRKSAVHTLLQKGEAVDPEWFMYSPPYYLSDGGYSRLQFDFETERLYLAVDARLDVVARWETCRALITQIERYVIAWIALMMGVN